ncbi:MAG: LAGLIDADG family homing endonuclease [Candidatus Nanohaloarchaea archaeon]
MTEENSGTGMNKYQLKKTINELEDIRGRNTELVSLYIPAGYDMSKISDFLTSEQNEAENIKSKHTRKNVQSALDKIARKVQDEHETPENGVAFFAGNVSEREGRPEIKVWEIVPPQPIESRHYRCDKEFVLEPLKEMVVDDRVYGLIVIDKNKAAIGYLQGSSVKTAYTMESNVPGKTRAGGQCLAPDTLVQLSNGELKEIQDIEVGDRVKSADFNSMSMKDSEVTDKWENEKQLYRIETKHPKMSIEASADHEVFINNEGVETKKAGDLEEGEKLLLPEEFDSDSHEPKLNTENLYNSFKISKEGRKRLKERRKEKGLSQRELGRKLGKTQAAVSKLEKDERDIRKNFLEDLIQELNLGKSFLHSYCMGKNFNLPTELDPELAQILGYFAGDGSFDSERLNFHEKDREVAERYRELLEKKFGCKTSVKFREDKNYYSLRAFGKPLVRLLKKEFPGLRKSRNTEFPEKIMLADDEVVSGFIRGFYDAEGHCSESRGRIGISANNKKFMTQLQQSLTRIGVISSLQLYDNSENPYSDNTRYTVSISDQASVTAFKNKIGFTADRKKKELEKIVADENSINRIRQVVSHGPAIRETLEKHGKTMNDFKSANTYLQGKREISKKAFRKNLVANSSGNLRAELEDEVSKPELLPAKIDSIEKTGKSRTIDISVKAGNFVANGLIVHNSAQRFARLRKEMLKSFLSETAEKAQTAFLDKARDDKLLGIVIGGPGFVKDKLVDENYLHQELEDKIVAVESLGHSGEGALKELVNKAEDAIEDSEVVREKNLVNKFLKNLKEENGKSEYGLKPVMKAMKMGAVETVLISETVNLYQAKYRCPNDHEKQIYEEKPDIEDFIKCEECSEEMELESIADIVDVLGEKAEEMSSDLKIISTDHEEGRRLENMGGIAAILRYRIR